MAELTESSKTSSSLDPGVRRIRLTIPPEQCSFIEQQARSRKIEFNGVVYELIRDRIQQLTEPTQEPATAMAEEMERIEAHLLEVKALIHSSSHAADTHDRSSDKDINDDRDAEEDEGNLARLITAILQGNLQPSLHRLIGQIETVQSEVCAANQAAYDLDQSHYQSELDRWFIAKAELEVLRDLIGRVAIAATPPEHRSQLVEHIAYVAERFKHFESRLPQLPEYFLSLDVDD
jgi:hypothetical protein